MKQVLYHPPYCTEKKKKTQKKPGNEMGTFTISNYL